MNIYELRDCLDILLRHVVAVHGIENVGVQSHDYYWAVSAEQWLSMEAEPELVVGSFIDDELELKKLISNPDRASAVDIDRIASLLRLLSDQIAGSKGGEGRG